MGKSLITIDRATGNLLSISKNHDFSNFIASETDKYKYVIAEDTLPVLSIPSQAVIATSELIGSSVPDILNDPDANPAASSATDITITNTEYRYTTLPSYFEQIIYGTAYDRFRADELAYQTNIQPIVFNHLILNGVSATAYSPTVETVGVSSGWVRGTRSLKCKGTYLDLTGTSAGGVRVPGGYSLENCTNHLISGHFYLSETPPSSYEATLFCLCNNLKSGTTRDTYKMVYDSASQRLIFHWSAQGYGGSGFQDSVNASPQGITLNTWHHFAVAYRYDGASATVATYYDGTQVDKVASTTNGYLRQTTEEFCVGADRHGHHPWKGWIDDLIVSAGTTITALRGINFTAGITVPQERQEAGDYTVYYLSMNGPVGQSIIPCENTHRISAAVDIQDASGVLYVSCIQREDGGIHGISLYGGVCGGYGVSGVCGAGYVFGKESGACIVVSGITQNLGITTEKQQKQNYAELSYRLLLGATAMYGSTGNSGDFKNLFSLSGWYPTHFNGYTFSHIAIQNETNEIKYLYDDIIDNGRTTGSYNIIDSNGNAFSFSTAGVQALYKDIINFHSQTSTETSGIKNQIALAANFTELKSIKGFTSDQTLFKLSQVAERNKSVFIAPTSKITGMLEVSEKLGQVELRVPVAKQ